MIEAQRHQQQPTELPVTSDSLRRLQLALEAQIVAAGAAGVLMFNGRSGNVSLTASDVNTALGYTPASGSPAYTDITGVPTDTFIGRDTAGAGTAEALTPTVATSLLNTFTPALKGLAPASGGGTANFLRADGTWAAPPAGGSYTPPTGTGFAHITSGSQDAAAKLVDTADINDAQVTLAKMANVATGTVFYRKTAATGAPEVQTLATLKTDLGLTGINSGDQTTITGNAGTATTLQTARNFSIAGGGITASAVSFNGSANVVLSASVDAGHITLARMANMATASLIYRKTAGTGAPEVNTLATLKTDLGLTGTNSGDQTITLTGQVTGSGTGSFATTIAAASVTPAQMAVMATNRILGRISPGVDTPEILTPTQVTSMLDTFTSSLKGVTPASGGGTVNFLRADGSWAVPFSPSASAPSAAWAIDFAPSTSAPTYVTIASGATYDLEVGSGMIFIYEDGGQGVAQIALYYGLSSIVWQNGSFYTTVSGTASKVNVYYNAGTGKYRIQNNSGASRSFFIGSFRVRTSS